MIFCKIRIISWHSFWSLGRAGLSDKSSIILSQYRASDASFLLIKTLFLKSFLEAESLASTKLAPTLVAERISWLINGWVIWFFGSDLQNWTISLLNTRVLSLKSIGALIIWLIGYSLSISSFVHCTLSSTCWVLLVLLLILLVTSHKGLYTNGNSNTTTWTSKT